MPNPLEITSAASPKSLDRRTRRSERKLQVVKVSNVGETLTKLSREERSLARAWACADKHPDIRERVEMLCKLEVAIDRIRERRRIVLGIPLPGVSRSKGRLLDVPAPLMLEAQESPPAPMSGPVIASEPLQ